MTLQLNLPAQIEKRLRQEADRQGLAPAAMTLKLLDQHLPQPLDDRRAAAIAMLNQWMEEDQSLSDEELAENQDLLRQIDEDRPSYRKLFNEILKDEQP